MLLTFFRYVFEKLQCLKIIIAILFGDTICVISAPLAKMKLNKLIMIANYHCKIDWLAPIARFLTEL